MTQANEPTVLAILARFDGDEDEAVVYCQEIVRTQPALRAEYAKYINEIITRKNKRQYA